MSNKTRLTESTEGKVQSGRRLGDPSLVVRDLSANSPSDFCKPDTVAVDFVKARLARFEEIKAIRAAETAAQPREPIQIKFRGKLAVIPEFSGTSWETRPFTLIKHLSDAEHIALIKAALKDAVVAKIFYKSRVGNQTAIADGSGVSDEAQEIKIDKGELWDLGRPLEGSCEIELLDFDDEQGKMVFWHSSAHVLGECLECGYGCHLTVGPPIATGFFYDAYMGTNSVNEDMKRDLEAKANLVCTVKQPGQQQPGQSFERVVISKAEALELFHANPFKVAMIHAKV